MRPIKLNSEQNVHQQVCDYLRIQYPNVMFHTDYAAGLRMTPGQAVRNKRLQSGRAWPDLFIAEPKWPSKGLMNNPDYTCGLFIEIKKEGTKIFLKDGETLVADEHVREQAETLKKLRDRGYKAVFGIGFEECKKIIDEYLSSRV